jgi:Domain of unknown function (DUF6896)
VQNGGMDAAEAVNAYVAAVRRVAVGDAHPAVIVSAVNSGSQAKSGVLAGGISYEKHGFGVRFVEPDGGSIDVDADLETEEVIFDVWRVRSYIDSLDELPLPDDEIIRALEDAATRGEIRSLDHGTKARPGWYALGESSKA